MQVPTKLAKLCGNFLLRSGTIVGTIYGTERAGVWKSPQETTQLYENCKSKLRPTMKEFGNRSPINMPAAGQLSNSLLSVYNMGVKKTFGFLVMLPGNSEQLGRQAFVLLKETGQKLADVAQAQREAAIRRAAEFTASRKQTEKESRRAFTEMLTDKLLILETEGQMEVAADKTEANDNHENKQQLLLLTSCL